MIKYFYIKIDTKFNVDISKHYEILCINTWYCLIITMDKIIWWKNHKECFFRFNVTTISFILFTSYY